MSDFQLHALIRGVLVPSLVTGAVYVLARLLPASIRDLLRAVGLAAGVLFSYVLLIGMPSWPLTGSPAGVITALLVAMIWMPLVPITAKRVWLRRYLILVVVVAVCLRPLMAHWSWMQIASHIGAITAVGVLAWAAMERGAQQMRPAGANAGLLVLAGTSAAFIGLTGSASLGQITGALAAGLGAATVLSLFEGLRPRTEFIEVTVLSLVALWACHCFYVDLNWMSLLWLLGPVVWFMVREMIGWSGSTPLKDAVTTVLITAPAGLWGLYLIYKAQSASPY